MLSALLLLVATACTGGAAPTPGAGAAGPVDFKGKTIHLVVGYSAGGGFDANARVLAPYLQQALQGNPAVVVENQPGADSLVAAKTVLTTPPRGDDISVVVYISTLLVKSVLDGGVEGFAPEKESVYLGKIDAAPQQLALCARKSAVPDLDSFLSRTTPLKVAGLTGSSYYDAVLRWTKEAGYPIDIVYGYAATAQMILAFNQGEVDAMPACRSQDLAANSDWLDNDQVTPLFYWADYADQLKAARTAGKYPWLKNVLDVKPVSPELKTGLETLNSVNTGTNVYAVNKQVAGPVQMALQAAFKQVVTSQAFIDDMNKRQLPVGYKGPEEIQPTLDQLASAAPETRELVKRLLGS